MRKAIEIMVEETNREASKIGQDINSIYSTHCASLPPLLIAKPEELDISPRMNQEEIYRKLAQINFRVHIVGHLLFDRNYMESAIRAYDKLIPLAEDKTTIDECVIPFLEFAEKWVKEYDQEI